MKTDEERILNIEVSIIGKWQTNVMSLFFDGSEVTIIPLEFCNFGALKYSITIENGDPHLLIFNKDEERNYTINLIDGNLGILELMTPKKNILIFRK